MTVQAERAEQFFKMHDKGSTFLLPNAWDAASARLFAEAGFPAIGTTSAGVAFANGYPDGERISRHEMLARVKQMANAVNVPVSADIEAGYGATPDDVAITIQGVMDAGAVGVNLEDTDRTTGTLFGVEAQENRIRAARQTAGATFVINARVDTYIRPSVPEASRFDETLFRAKAYVEAGATSIFVLGVVDRATIEALVRGIPAPLNVMAGPGALPIADLFAIGVTRVSIGDAAMLATMGLVRQIAQELRATGTYSHMAQHPFTFAEANKLFATKPG